MSGRKLALTSEHHRCTATHLCTHYSISSGMAKSNMTFEKVSTAKSVPDADTKTMLIGSPSRKHATPDQANSGADTWFSGVR